MVCGLAGWRGCRLLSWLRYWLRWHIIQQVKEVATTRRWCRGALDGCRRLGWRCRLKIIEIIVRSRRLGRGGFGYRWRLVVEAEEVSDRRARRLGRRGRVFVIARMILFKVGFSAAAARRTRAIHARGTATSIVRIAAKATITTAATARHKVAAADTLVLGAIRTSLAALRTDRVKIGKKSSELFRTRANIDALILALLVNVVEVAQDFDRG